MQRKSYKMILMQSKDRQGLVSYVSQKYISEERTKVKIAQRLVGW